ncbi:MAG: DNA-binding protein [Methylococcaceae bacterium]|nr:DNA-binding protein [Methylococcaceae bacterium]
MARAGITEQQVFEAAQGLLQEGQTVSVSAVRERLGSGSYSTINAHLTKWREDNNNRKPSDIPDIPSSVENALRHIWALAWKEALDPIKSEREGLETVRREMEREKKVMEAEIAGLETQSGVQAVEITRIGDALAEKVQDLDEAKTTNQTLSIENARLEERVKAAEGRAGDLRQELDKLHERLRELAAAKPETAARTSRKPEGAKKR